MHSPSGLESIAATRNAWRLRSNPRELLCGLGRKANFQGGVGGRGGSRRKGSGAGEPPVPRTLGGQPVPRCRPPMPRRLEPSIDVATNRPSGNTTIMHSSALASPLVACYHSRVVELVIWANYLGSLFR